MKAFVFFMIFCSIAACTPRFEIEVPDAPTKQEYELPEYTKG